MVQEAKIEKKKPHTYKGMDKIPNSGRKKGTRNKNITMQQLHAELMDSGISPIEYLMSIVRAPVPPALQAQIDKGNLSRDVINALMIWDARRLEAAKIAAPYCHAKVAPISADGDAIQPVTLHITGLSGGADKSSGDK